jgi:hypothetical protein
MKEILRLWQSFTLAVEKWLLRRRLRRIIIEGRKTPPPLTEEIFNKSDTQ